MHKPAHPAVVDDDSAEAAPALLQMRAEFIRWQSRAAEAGLSLRAPPPEPTTCCGRGCNGCVWEGFYDAARYWCEEAQLRLDAG